MKELEPKEEFEECLRVMRWGHRWEMFPFLHLHPNVLQSAPTF